MVAISKVLRQPIFVKVSVQLLRQWHDQIWAWHSKHLSPSEILILRLTRTRLCSAFYYNYKAFVITLLYYTVLIVTNMTGNSNCFDHFDVPCIPTSKSQVKTSILFLQFLAFSFVWNKIALFIICYYNCFAIVKKSIYIRLLKCYFL